MPQDRSGAWEVFEPSAGVGGENPSCMTWVKPRHSARERLPRAFAKFGADTGQKENVCSDTAMCSKQRLFFLKRRQLLAVGS